MSWDDTLMDSILEKASKYAVPIHGGKYMTKVKWFWGECTKREKSFLDDLESASFAHCLSQFPSMRRWKRGDFLFLSGPAGTGAQQWHFDTREGLMAVTGTVGGSTTPTEFAPFVYTSIDVDDENLHLVTNTMKLPKEWTDIEPYVTPPEWHAPKTIFPFMTDALHRGPAVPMGAKDRMGIYISWGPDGANTNRFIDKTFFNSLVDKYVYTHTHKPPPHLHNHHHHTI
jgi:hypothetical protein